MKTVVRPLSATCPGDSAADTHGKGCTVVRGKCSGRSELRLPDNLSALTDISSTFDKPDKTTPPYRGVLSVSAVEVGRVAFNASSNGSSAQAPAPLDAGVSVGRGTMEFVHLDGGMIVPLPAWLVVLAVERAGHRLRVDGGKIIIEPGGGLAPTLVAELKRWKPHAIMLLGYVADDCHLRGPQGHVAARKA